MFTFLCKIKKCYCCTHYKIFDQGLSFSEYGKERLDMLADVLTLVSNPYRVASGGNNSDWLPQNVMFFQEKDFRKVNLQVWAILRWNS